MSAILNSARVRHEDAVKERIENVKQLSGVVDITKTLFEVSKVRFEERAIHQSEQMLTSLQETVKLEAQAYDLEQKTTVAQEAKNVLDSWIRYEGQVKQRQQRELADTVIAKVEKDLEDPKVLRQILDQSVKDVERKFLNKASLKSHSNQHEGILTQKS